MIKIRYSDERGKANHGWLQSRFTFSFAHYYDEKHMGASKLRVINDDVVKPGRGFDTHSHENMEIISYVKKGMIEHKDTMGNIKKLPAGEFQLMSAGSGVSHSEYNPSNTEDLEFLQIWIQPNVLDVEPGYQQKLFDRKKEMHLIVSPDGREASLQLHQDAYLYQLLLDERQCTSHILENGRTVYVHVISGVMNINGEKLKAGDGATVTEIDVINFTGIENTEALVFDLP